MENESRKFAKALVRCLNGHSRSKMYEFMVEMAREGILTREDLAQFSPELQEQLRYVFE